MKKIKNLDELDQIKINDSNKHKEMELRYFKNCIIDHIFDTEWSEDAEEHKFYYNIGVGIEIEEFDIEIYVEATWDAELRGRLDFNNYNVLGVTNRDGEELEIDTELQNAIIKKLK